MGREQSCDYRVEDRQGVTWTCVRGDGHGLPHRTVRVRSEGREAARPCDCPREQRPDYFCPVHEAEHLPSGRATVRQPPIPRPTSRCKRHERPTFDCQDAYARNEMDDDQIIACLWASEVPDA